MHISISDKELLRDYADRFTKASIEALRLKMMDSVKKNDWGWVSKMFKWGYHANL